MKKLILCFLTTLLIPLLAQAQSDVNSPYSIKGQVVDSLTNETVPYATLSIAVSSTPHKAEKLLACDIDGKFETVLKTPGTYIITMQSIGKATTKTQFTLTANRGMRCRESTAAHPRAPARPPIVKIKAVGAGSPRPILSAVPL